MGTTEPVAVLPALYDYLKCVALKVAAFPRVHRLTLGDRLFTTLLDVLDALIDAQYLRTMRRQALQRANAASERSRYLLRLAKDCQCLSLREYEVACGHTLTVGRMIGGWLRHAQAARSASGAHRRARRRMSSCPADGLFERFTSFKAPREAARLARRGKRRSRAVAAFEHRLEYVLIEMQALLRDDSFCFGAYREFEVREPVPRRIPADPYRDRVVHHALCAQLEPVLERRMLPCSLACRVGYGSHRALDTLQQHLRGGSRVLKVDVSKYFYSVDHAILRASLAQRIAGRRTLALVDLVLATYSAHNEFYFPQPGDDLWAPSRPRGLTSQLFANWHLNPVDSFVKRTLGWRRYVRYMDDPVFVGPSREVMAEVREAVLGQLALLRLMPNPRKTQFFPASQGVRFAGFRVYAHHRRLLRASTTRFNRRMRRYRREVAAGRMSFDEVRASLPSYMGFAGERLAALVNRLLGVHAFDVPGRPPPQRFLMGRCRESVTVRTESARWLNLTEATRTACCGQQRGAGPSSYRVLRGGSCYNNAINARSANRNNTPSNRNNNGSGWRALVPRGRRSPAGDRRCCEGVHRSARASPTGVPLVDQAGKERGRPVRRCASSPCGPFESKWTRGAVCSVRPC